MRIKIKRTNHYRFYALLALLIALLFPGVGFTIMFKMLFGETS